jgi:hypothetical protein
MSDESAETIIDAENGEVVTDVSEGGKRKIRVYDPKGDFVIEVPEGATVTFGYFNPSAPREGRDFGPSHDNVARQTALRIYTDKGTKQENQLACFIGVKGFRDLSITITRLRQHVVVETNYEDDGDNVKWGGNRQQRLIAQPEELDF